MNDKSPIQTDAIALPSHYPRHIAELVNWEQKIDVAPLYDVLLQSAEKYPHNICLDFKGRKYTYAQIAHQAKCFANGLQKIAGFQKIAELEKDGLNHGAHVGLFMPNCPQFVIAYFGILLAGGVVVNYNPLYSTNELKHQINDSDTEIMVTLNIKRLYDKVAPLIGETTLKHVIIASLADALPQAKGLLYNMLKRKELSHIAKHKYSPIYKYSPTCKYNQTYNKNNHNHHHFKSLLKHGEITEIADICPNLTIAVLQYTGGTTGVPKGVMLTHANLYANVVMCKRWFFDAKEGQEIIMGVLPFFHVFAMTTVMNYGVASGANIILHPRFEIKAVLKDITNKCPTIMAGVPTMFAAMVNYPKLSDYNLSSLKACISGGAGLPLEVKKNFEAKTGCVLVEGYGLSESSPVVACNPFVGANKAGSIGLPFPQTIFAIMDKDDGVTGLEHGQIGEICVQGEQIMHGYYGHPLETEKTLQNGWLHTGDLGYIDDENYIFVVDRKKEMIISGGYNIYPRQIEEAIYTHEKVLECAVIGITHEVKGEVPKAFIVLRASEQLTEIELRLYLKQRISAYCVPNDYVFVEFLPKSIIGKILKKDLR